MKFFERLLFKSTEDPVNPHVGVDSTKSYLPSDIDE